MITVQSVKPNLKHLWSEILNAYSRCDRLARRAPVRFTVNPFYLIDPHEQAMWVAIETTKQNLTNTDSMMMVIGGLDTLVQPISNFFANVMVMTDDENLRHNRLALLQEISELTRGYADFSKLQGY